MFYVVFKTVSDSVIKGVGANDKVDCVVSLALLLCQSNRQWDSSQTRQIIKLVCTVLPGLMLAAEESRDLLT